MFWEETKPEPVLKVPDDIVDLVYGISCRTIPVDHAYELSTAIQQHLPWIVKEAQAAMHTIHVAASSNGWIRPDNPDDLLHLSRRTKLMLRVPKHRVEDAKQLLGKVLSIGDNDLLVKDVTVKQLSNLTTLFARYIATHDDVSEMEFLVQMKQQLKQLNINPKKMLCGTETAINTPQGRLRTRSLMLAELELSESITLQQTGLGQYLHMGCGIFIPHKDIKDLAEG